MINKIKNALRNPVVWILLAVSFIFGILFGFINKPFFLHFIDGITYFAFAYLFIGIIRWGFLRADFAYFSWKPDKGSYNRYRQRLMENRTTKKNPVLTAGVINFIIAAILAVLY